MEYKNNKNEEGLITIITVLTLGILILSISGTVALNAIGQISKNRNLAQGDQMFYTADAQAREGAYQAILDTDYTGSSPLSLNGSTSGSVAAVKAWPLVTVTSVSENDLIQRTVIYTVNIFPEGASFNHAVYANPNLELSGSVEVSGDIFSNGDISFNGNPSIDGDVYSVGTADTSNNLNGETYPDVEPISPPGVDLDFYRDEAQANGTYFEDTGAAENYIENNFNEGDIVFIEAPDQQINIDTDLTGSIVTTGNLRINGGTYTASDGHFAIIGMGDLRLAGNATINGVVYVFGETTFSGGGAIINGTLISAQGVSETSLTGNVIINYDPTYIFVTEENTTSSEAPQIELWREE